MKRFLLLIFLSATVVAAAQHNFSLRYVGLTIHPLGDDQAQLQPYKLDKRAVVVINYGAFAAYEKYVLDDLLSVKFMQGVFADCAAGLSGFSHVGVRGLMFDRGKHRVMLGFGPLFYMRRDWNRFPDYVDSGYFNRYHSRNFGDFQYKMFWYAFEFEYDCKLNDHLDFNLGFTPGVPLAMSFSFGVKYWPHRNFPEPKKERLFIPKQKKEKTNQ